MTGIAISVLGLVLFFYSGIQAANVGPYVVKSNRAMRWFLFWNTMMLIGLLVSVAVAFSPTLR